LTREACVPTLLKQCSILYGMVGLDFVDIPSTNPSLPFLAV